MNFDPDQPDLHFACQVFYAPLGSVRLVAADGAVLATQRYGNDQNDPSRAALTALPGVARWVRNRSGPDDPRLRRYRSHG